MSKDSRMDVDRAHIRIRGEQVMLGYSDPDATRAAMPDGWFHPGDIGVINEDRWMRVTGRTKDIISRGGEKLSSADIEAAIQRHPGVPEVAVLGVPHDRLRQGAEAHPPRARCRMTRGRIPRAGGYAPRP